MTSNRPYLIRALYEWIVDNGMTPHLLVDARHSSAVVPMQFVDDGRIVLNVAPYAVQALELGNETIRFSARFGGTPFAVALMPAAVLGLYARENGHGMLFPEEETSAEGQDSGAAENQRDDASGNGKPGPDDGGGSKKPSRPALRVVK